MERLRSWLFVPGHRQRMLDRALAGDADAVILDLEDGVPAAEKEAARERVAAVLSLPPGGPRRWVRVRAEAGEARAGDLEAAVRPGLDGLVLPKVESAAAVRAVEAELEQREAAAGLPRGAVRLVATIESARGLVRAPEIAAASPRLVGLLFGAEDFMLDMGMPALGEGAAEDLLYARSAVAVAAACERLQALDRVFPDARDVEGLVRDAAGARRLGFSGKALIHPAQVEPVHRVFRPSAEEVERARRILAAFDTAEAGGTGAVLVDGAMVDRPVAERARRLLREWETGEQA